MKPRPPVPIISASRWQEDQEDVVDKRMARAIGCLVGVAVLLGACGGDDAGGGADDAEANGQAAGDGGGASPGEAPGDGGDGGEGGDGAGAVLGEDPCPMTFLPPVEEVEAALGFGVGEPVDILTMDEVGTCGWLADDGETMVTYELSLSSTDCADRPPSADATPVPGLGQNAEWRFEEEATIDDTNVGRLYVCYSFEEELSLEMQGMLGAEEMRSALQQLASTALQHLDARA